MHDERTERRIDRLREWALRERRPLLAWLTPSGRGVVWLDVEYVTVTKPRPYPGAGGVTHYDWHNPIVIHEKIRPNLGDRILRGLRRTKRMERDIVYYVVTDGEHITDEYDRGF